MRSAASEQCDYVSDRGIRKNTLFEAPRTFHLTMGRSFFVPQIDGLERFEVRVLRDISPGREDNLFEAPRTHKTFCFICFCAIINWKI